MHLEGGTHETCHTEIVVKVNRILSNTAIRTSSFAFPPYVHQELRSETIQIIHIHHQVHRKYVKCILPVYWKHPLCFSNNPPSSDVNIQGYLK